MFNSLNSHLYQIESGRGLLEESPFDLHYLIEEILDLIASKTTDRATEKPLELLAVIDVDVPQWIVSDADYLRQILVDLISNAIKFTESSEITITVSTALIEQDIDISQSIHQLTFTITDIEIGSEIGKDRTFSFSINAQAIATEPTAITPEFKNKNLLIINSNPTIQQIISNYAQSWGIVSQPAYCEVEALKHLEVSDFDAAIIDQNLQSLDVFELVRNIHDIFPSLPIILLPSISTYSLTIPNIFSGYLNKPITKSKLYQLLLNIFSEDKTKTTTSQYLLAINNNINIDFAKAYPLNILIVEDNLVNQQILLLMLERLGYQGDAVNHGLEAVQTFQKRTYDLVFMDIQMPIMDGLTACQQIRQLRDRNPWIIGLSANAFRDARETALSVGMNDYLTKPLNLEDLIITLQKVSQNLNSIYQISDHLIEPETKQLHSLSKDKISSSSVYPQTNFAISGLEIINEMTLEMLEHGVGKEDLPEIIEAYLSESARSIAAMQCAFKELDFAKISFENHSLKGGCGILGADRMVAICKELSILYKSEEYINKIEMIESLLQQLEIEYIKIRQLLQDKIEAK